MKAIASFILATILLSSCAGTEEQSTTSTTTGQAEAYSDTTNQGQNAQQPNDEENVSANNQVGRDQNIVAIAQFTPELSTFFELIRAADLTVILESPGRYTVFAPTNQAFSNLPAGALDALREPVNRDELTRVLRSHIIEDRKITAAELKNSTSYETALGRDVKITVENGTTRVGDAGIVKENIDASNGVVHIIDRVLIPPKD